MNSLYYREKVYQDCLENFKNIHKKHASRASINATLSCMYMHNSAVPLDFSGATEMHKKPLTGALRETLEESSNE